MLVLLTELYPCLQGFLLDGGENLFWDSCFTDMAKRVQKEEGRGGVEE